MYEPSSNNQEWPLEDNEQFAQLAIEKIKALLPEVKDRSPLSYNLITAPANRELLEKYFIPDESEDLFRDDEVESIFTPENMPDEINYVKIYYGNLEFVLFLDEYGINDEFTPRVHLQYLCNHDVHRDNTRCEKLCQLIEEEATRIIHDTYIVVGCSESEDLNAAEDILDIRPFIDISVNVEDFAESLDNHLLAMLKILMPTVEKDAKNVATDSTIQKPHIESLTKAEFEDKVLDELVRYAKQHRDLSVNIRVARKVVSDIIGGCPEDSSLVDYITRQLPELKDKAEESEKMFRIFKYDIKHNEVFLNYWKYYEDMKPRLTLINQIALKLGIDVKVYTNGVEYNNDSHATGLNVNDWDGELPLKYHISPITKLFHSSKLKQIKSVVEPFQKEFAEYVKTHKPSVLAEGEKYKDYTIFNVYAKYDPRYCMPSEYVIEEIKVTPREFLSDGTAKSLYSLFSSTTGTRRAVYEAMRITINI